MNKENFKIIKEINSLEEKLLNFDRLKSEDKKRIQRLFDQKSYRKEDLNEATLKKDALQKELFSIDRRTMEIEKTLNENKNKLNSIFDEEIIQKLESHNSQLNEELCNIQARGLEILEVIESLDGEIIDAQSFLKGIDETINEITEEILAHQKVEDISENSVHQRINEISNELTSDFKATYMKLKDNAPSHHSISLLKDKKCQFCHFELTAKKIEEIEIKLQPRACDMCKRILIPEQASY